LALAQLESGADILANLAAIERFAAGAARDGAVLDAFRITPLTRRKRWRGSTSGGAGSRHGTPVS
jgi:hypothetical protein